MQGGRGKQRQIHRPSNQPVENRGWYSQCNIEAYGHQTHQKLVKYDAWTETETKCLDDKQPRGIKKH